MILLMHKNFVMGEFLLFDKTGFLLKDLKLEVNKDEFLNEDETQSEYC